MLDEHYKQLVGGHIIHFELQPDQDTGEEWPVFLVQIGDKQLAVFVSMDPEGNGPGHLDIIEARRS